MEDAGFTREDLGRMTGQSPTTPPELVAKVEAKVASIQEAEFLDSARAMGALRELNTQFKAKVTDLEGENEVLRGQLKKLSEELDVALKATITPEERKFVGRTFRFGLFGSLVVAVWLIYCCMGAYRAYSDGSLRTSGVPFDELAGTFRAGECTDTSKPCVDLPLEPSLVSARRKGKGGATFWNSTQDNSISHGLRDLHAGKGLMPVPVMTECGQVDLRDLRNSMQRKLHRSKDYDFMCATFLGYPIDYCVTAIANEGGGRRWLDIVGGIRPTAVAHTTVFVETSLPEGLCVQTGTGQSPRYEAYYFARMCFIYTQLDGTKAETCVRASDAVVLQQLYEMQWGMVSCCSGDSDRLDRFIHRMRINSINGN